MDYPKVARELVRALRGRRSQVAVSKRLGFRTNVLYTWESGRSSPHMGEFLRFAERVGKSPEQVVVAFYRTRPTWLTAGLSPAEVALELLRDQRRQVQLV